MTPTEKLIALSPKLENDGRVKSTEVTHGAQTLTTSLSDLSGGIDANSDRLDNVESGLETTQEELDIAEAAIVAVEATQALNQPVIDDNEAKVVSLQSQIDADVAALVAHNSSTEAHGHISDLVTAEADRAEAAADAASLSANVYPDTTAGLAAVGEGEYFSVPSAEDTEYLILYQDLAGVATEVKRYPSKLRIDQTEDTARAEFEQPNVLSSAQVYFDVLPTGIGSPTQTVETYDGRKSLKVENTAGIGPRVLWSVPASEFASGKFSAQLTIISASVGTSGGIELVQRDIGTARVADEYIVQGLSSAITQPTTYQSGGIVIHPDAVTIELDILMANGSGDREFIVQSPMLVDGSVSGFRIPVQETGVGQLRDFTQDATNTTLVSYDVPLALQGEVVQGDYVITTSETSVDGKVYGIDIDANLSSSEVGAVKLAETFVSGEIVRLTATLSATGTTPSLGIGFGSAADLKGFILRTNAQLLTGALPSNVTGAASGPAANTYTAGDTLVIDARLMGGTPGDYTVDYYIEYEDGQRLGPYSVSGIDNLDSIWFLTRAEAEWSDVTLSRHEQPVYLQEFLDLEASSRDVVYVATSGSDSNAGTLAAPLATFNAAITAIGGNGLVQVGGGEYRQTLDMTGILGEVHFRAKKDKRVTILGSDQLSLSKTGGFTQVYDAALAAKPTGIGGSRGAPMIFEWGTPSKLIADADRHDLQRGETHRLPYTEMLEATSLAELDTPSGLGKWWWDAGTIYLAATDGSDATLGRYETRIRECVNGGAGGSVKFSRVDAFFSSLHGMNSRAMHSIEREECRAFGNYQNGFADDANFIKSVRDEAAGNGNDGFNGTVTAYAGTGNREKTVVGVYFDPYGHDNYDDGISYHVRGECSVYGGLFEFNTKAGVVHVTGAQCANYDTLCRYNGNGFYSATDAPDGRVTSVLRTHNCISHDNDYNYRAVDADLLAFNSISAGTTLTGYAQSGTGKIEARNCKHAGGDLAKSGNVIVTTDPDLV